MVSELCNGRMEPDTKGIGKIIMQMEKANLFMQLEIFMMVSGLEIKLMGLVLTQVLILEEVIQVNGKTIYSMVKGLRNGKMIVIMKEISNMEKRAD